MEATKVCLWTECYPQRGGQTKIRGMKEKKNRLPVDRPYEQGVRYPTEPGMRYNHYHGTDSTKCRGESAMMTAAATGEGAHLQQLLQW